MFHLDESSISGSFAKSGSELNKLTKFFISASESSMLSSMLISIMLAPAMAWFLTVSIASEYLWAAMRLLNALEPATLALSPIRQSSAVLAVAASVPLSFKLAVRLGFEMVCGLRCLTSALSAAMCSGVDPQHPPSAPATFVYSFILFANSTGLCVYSPSSFGRPAFG